MRTPKELFYAVESGNITAEELEFIIKKIDQVSPQDSYDNSLYYYLNVLEQMGSAENEALVQKFIHWPQDAMLSGLAIEILCCHWGLSAKYVNQIKMFIQGVKWDQDGDARLSALKCSGYYLSSFEDKDLLSAVYEVFCNQSEHSVNRERAYVALASAVGKDRLGYQLDEKPNDPIIREIEARLGLNKKYKLRTPKKLFHEAQSGDVTNEELEFVIRKVDQSGPQDCPDESLYYYLYIVGLMGSNENETLVQKFINCPQDPMISGLAIRILCCYWDLAANYLEQLKAFINSVEWDKDGDVRLAALSCAGYYLWSVEDKDLLGALYKAYCDPSADYIERETVYTALAEATGRNWKDYQFGEKPNDTIIQEVEARLGLNTSSKLRTAQELYQAAKSREVTKEELKFAVEQVESASEYDFRQDIYYYLYVIGLVGSSEYAPVVERFLRCPEKPSLTAAALRVLCYYWSLTPQYIDTLVTFIKGVSWDTDADARISAMGCAASYLLNNENKKLLWMLLYVFSNDQENEVMQETAYSAVATAVGQSWEEYQKDQKPNQLIIELAVDKLRKSPL